MNVLLELKGVSITQLKSYYKNKEDEDMTIKEFQLKVGLKEDGIAGTQTKAMAKEMLDVIYEILEIPNFSNAEEVAEAVTNNPDLWKDQLKKVKYLPEYTMAIVKKMRGE